MNKKSTRRGTGQGLVEFALILPVILLLTMGIIDFGRIIAIYNEVAKANREALRYAIVHPTDCAGITGVARQSVQLIAPNSLDVTVEIDNGMDPADGGQIVASCPIPNPGSLVIEPGWRMRVSVQTTVAPLTPIVNNIIQPIPLSYSGARTIFNEVGVVQNPPPAGKIEGTVTYWGCQMVITTVRTLEPHPIEVINVIDMSGSMSSGWGGQGDTSNPRKIASAKSALIMFNNMLDPSFGDVVGLVSFPGEIRTVAQYNQPCGGKADKLYLGKVWHNLTSNFATVNNTINSLSASGYTPIADGLRRARQILLAGHTEGRTPVIILATDGMANVRPGTSVSDPINGRLTGFDGWNPISPPCNAEAHNGAIYEALLTKDEGIILFTIAIGDDFNSEALQSMATSGFFFQAVNQEQLQAAYATIRQVAAYTTIGEMPMTLVRDGARARIRLDDGHGHVFITVADDAGHFAFYNIPHGRYTLTGSGEYTGQTYDVTTNGVNGDPITVIVNLGGTSATQDVFLTTRTSPCQGGGGGPTNTPGPSPTVPPYATPMPTNTPAPMPLYVNVNYPASNGGTIATIGQTRFEVIAYDPNVGTYNGAGISDVDMQIVGPNGIILSTVDNTTPWCVFAGDDNPCAQWRTWSLNNPYNGYSNVNFDDAPDGTYTIRARARRTLNSPWSAWVERTFVLSHPPRYLAITVPAQDGDTFTLKAQTPFEAVAYDPYYGLTNGSGVSKIQFQLYDPSNTLILDHTEPSKEYCTFSGNAPCPVWKKWDSGSTNFSTKEWYQLDNGVYVLKARAQWQRDGSWSDWVARTFVVNHVQSVVITVPPAGAVLTDQSQTAFEATAYDTAYGTNNGDGVNKIEFEVYDPSGNKIVYNSDTAVTYCAFKNNGTPCYTWRKFSGSTFSTKTWSELVNGTYTIKARAQWKKNSLWSDWVVQTFTVQK